MPATLPSGLVYCGLFCKCILSLLFEWKRRNVTQELLVLFQVQKYAAWCRIPRIASHVAFSILPWHLPHPSGCLAYTSISLYAYLCSLLTRFNCYVWFFNISFCPKQTHLTAAQAWLTYLILAVWIQLMIYIPFGIGRLLECHEFNNVYFRHLVGLSTCKGHLSCNFKATVPQALGLQQALLPMILCVTSTLIGISLLHRFTTSWRTGP